MEAKGICRSFGVYHSIGTHSGFGKAGGSYVYRCDDVASTSVAINVTINAPSSDWWIQARSKVKQFEKLGADWNGYGSAAPNATSLHWATVIIDMLYNESLRPAKVVPSAAGGIAICFVKTNKYADIEILNAGDIVVLTKDKSTGVRNVWTVLADEDEIQRALEQISAHIN